MKVLTGATFFIGKANLVLAHFELKEDDTVIPKSNILTASVFINSKPGGKCFMKSKILLNANLSYSSNIRNLLQYGLSKYTDNNSLNYKLSRANRPSNVIRNREINWQSLADPDQFSL